MIRKPTKATVDARFKLKPEIHDWIMAAAKARRTNPATIINELVQVQLEVMPGLADLLPIMEHAKKEGDRIGAIRDYLLDTMEERDDAVARLDARLSEIEARYPKRAA